MADCVINRGEDALPPTHKRFLLIGWLCLLSTILYLDRICFSQSVDPIQQELHLSNKEISFAAMAFTLAYGLFAVPVGRLGDRFGSRAVLAAIVLGWSAFTGLTGAATGLLMLVAVRFLFGATEAGAFPNAARVISRWFPLSERGRVQGTMLAAAQLGGIIAPPAAAALIDIAGWRWAFAAFATIGVLWAAGFWLWFRDDPAEHAGVNAAELAAIRADAPALSSTPGPVPWRSVVRNRGIIVLSAIMALGSFFTYFFYTWFPKYLKAAREVENRDSGWLAALVLFGSLVGVFVGGWLADRIPRWLTDPIRGRRILGVAGYASAAALLFWAVRCHDPLAVAALCSASFCAMHLTLPNWWSAIIPQSGPHVGALFGLANGIGILGAVSSQGFVGIFTDWQAERGLAGRAQWDPIFDVYVVVLLLGALAWWLYRFQPLDEERDMQS